MLATKSLRQAAAAAVHAEHIPMIRFIGKRSIPAQVDHPAKPHPASPTGALPPSFSSHGASSHTSFSSYRDRAQQFGPLRKTIKAESTIGSSSGAQLGDVAPPKGHFFDRSHLGSRFARTSLSEAEMEAIESGGASQFA